MFEEQLDLGSAALRFQIEGLAGEPAAGGAHLVEGPLLEAHARLSAVRLEIQIEPAVASRIEVGLGRGEHQRRVSGGDELHAGAVLPGELVHHREQGWDDAQLPLGVKVRLDLIDEEDDLGGRLVAQELGGGEVLVPGPHQQISERDDAAHASRGMDDGNILAVRHRERRIALGIIDGDLDELARAERLFLAR